MARKKGSSDFEEAPDEAAVEVEVTDEGFDPEPATVEPTLTEHPKVTIKEQAKPAAPEVGASTKAEMEAGRKAIADKAADKQELEDRVARNNAEAT